MIKYVSDLTDEQLNIVLAADSQSASCKCAGKTLREMIHEAGIQTDITIATLYDMFENAGLKWPFRTITITVEVTHSRGYTVGVLGEDDITDLRDGSSCLEDIAPNFSLENAYDEAYTEFIEGESRYDYSVEDDTGRVLVDWDD